KFAVHLPTQRMEVLRGRAEIADLHVSLGAQLEEALETRAGVLRALSFVAVGQEHHEPRHATPLVLGAGDELIDDDLRAVDEVAELRLPDDEAPRIGGGVAVLEAEDRLFRERSVDDLEVALLLANMIER